MHSTKRWTLSYNNSFKLSNITRGLALILFLFGAYFMNKACMQTASLYALFDVSQYLYMYLYYFITATISERKNIEFENTAIGVLPANIFFLAKVFVIIYALVTL